MLITAELGAWFVAIPAGLYLVLPLFSRNKGSVARVRRRPHPMQSVLPKRVAVGVVLVVIALFARFSGGVWSPFVLASGGVLVLLSGRIGSSYWFGRLEAIEDSILLRRRNLPLFQWISVAEIKLATSQVVRALSTVSGTLIVRWDGTTSLYLVLKGFALTRELAEKQFLERMRRINRFTARRGGFLLPLDGEQASQRLRLSVEPLKLDEANWGVSLESAPSDMVIFNVAGGYVEGVGVYSLDEEASERSMVPSARQKFKKKPLTWEVLQKIGDKFDWPQSDDVTSFLGSLFAARGEPVGALLEGDGNDEGETVLVRTLSSVPVKLSRVQLRALAKMYDAG